MIDTCDMCCGLVAVEVMCTTEALGILKLFSPSSGTVVTCNKAQYNKYAVTLLEYFISRSNKFPKTIKSWQLSSAH